MNAIIELPKKLRARVAGASYGEPVCIEPLDAKSDGLSLSVYTMRGAIVGVVVANDEGEVIGEIGLTPGYDTEQKDA
jgi:hypothetical protein